MERDLLARVSKLLKNIDEAIKAFNEIADNKHKLPIVDIDDPEKLKELLTDINDSKKIEELTTSKIEDSN